MWCNMKQCIFEIPRITGFYCLGCTSLTSHVADNRWEDVISASGRRNADTAYRDLRGKCTGKHSGASVW